MLEIQSIIHHQLGRDAAFTRIHELVATLSERFPQQVHQVHLQLHHQKIQVRFAAYGYMVGVQTEVTETDIIVHTELPESANKFQAKIVDAIVDRLESALAPSVTGQAA
jgi:GH35 family endo-1,4-beta-xylanase